MEDNFTTLKSLLFYSYGNTHCSVDLVFSKNYDKIYIRFFKSFDYKKDGEDKTSRSYVLYTVLAAEALFKVLGAAINDAKHIKGVPYISKYLA